MKLIYTTPSSTSLSVWKSAKTPNCGWDIAARIVKLSPTAERVYRHSSVMVFRDYVKIQCRNTLAVKELKAQFHAAGIMHA